MRARTDEDDLRVRITSDEKIEKEEDEAEDKDEVKVEDR